MKHDILFTNGKRNSWVSRADLNYVINFCKRKIKDSDNNYQKLAWAEVGLELNRIYMHLGVRTPKYFEGRKPKKK